MAPREAAPGASVTLNYIMMPRPATCSPTVHYPNGTTAALPAQTAVYLDADRGHGMSWTWSVPATMTAGAAEVTAYCTYQGSQVGGNDGLGFTILP